jgi:hypothetical protein
MQYKGQFLRNYNSKPTNTTDRLFPTGNFFAGVYATKDVSNDLYNIKIKQ